MWIRQCELDDQQSAALPIPARIASNEEFIPPPQSRQQQEYEARLMEISDRAAQRQGLVQSFVRVAILVTLISLVPGVSWGGHLGGAVGGGLAAILLHLTGARRRPVRLFAWLGLALGPVAAGLGLAAWLRH